MKMNNSILTRIKKKALQSYCTYKIAAVGLNKKGDIIAYAANSHRFTKHGGGIHAEMKIMANYNVSSIIICRVSSTGNLLPIHPCKTCLTKAKELNIKITTII